MKITNEEIKSFLTKAFEERPATYQPFADEICFERVNFQKDSFSEFIGNKEFSKFIFKRCTFHECDFLTGDLLLGFEHCKFVGTTLRDLRIEFMEFFNCDFENIKMKDCFSPDLRILGGEIGTMRMEHCYFPRAQFNQKNISGLLNIESCLLAGAKFSDTKGISIKASIVVNATQSGNGTPSFIGCEVGDIDPDFLEEEFGYVPAVLKKGSDLSSDGVIVKFLIPKGSRRTELSSGLRRTERVQILEIKDSKGNCFETAYKYREKYKGTRYLVGGDLSSKYDPNPVDLCGEGIYYFKTKTDASEWMQKAMLYE